MVMGMVGIAAYISDGQGGNFFRMATGCRSRMAEESD